MIITRPQHHQHGLSLIELMIAITLSLVLTLGVIQIFSSSKQTNSTQTALGDLQENARFALDLLSYDLRMAGNLGCNRNSTVTNLAADVKLPGIGSGIVGYAYAGSPATLELITDSAKNPAKAVNVEDTDAFVVRYVSPNAQSVASITVAATDSVTLAARSTINGGDPVMISDCHSADIFIAGPVTNTNKTISMKDAKHFSKSYGSDAEVAPLNYVAYYIRQDNVTKVNNLYRSRVKGIVDIASPNRGEVDIQDHEPLLEGVDNMQLLYGEDLNGNGSSIRYVPAGTAGLDMNRVTSIRLSLLFRTIDNGLASGDQSYWLNGVNTTMTTADNSDKKLYRGFTTTIKLRNQGIGL